MSEPCRVRVWVAPLALMGAFAFAAGLVIAWAAPRGRAAEDQINYHERVVRTFAAQWPSPDVGDYLSATTPGYHLSIAAAAQVVGHDTRAWRAVGAFYTLALIGLLASWSARRVGTGLAIALVAPVAASMYVFEAGAWLLPDNAAWLLVAAILMLALRSKRGVGSIALAGVILALLVLMRQIHVWTAGVLWLSAWLASEPANPFVGFARRARDLAPAFLATIPAAAVLAWFAWIWSGLTPPFFQQPDPNLRTNGINLANPAFLLCIVGGFSLFFVAWWAPALAGVIRTRPGLALAAALAGLLVAVVPETSWSKPEGRWGAAWEIVRKLPTFSDRSPVIWAGSALGALSILGWMRSLPARSAWIFGAAFAGFAAAQTFNFNVWQRYMEPLVLILLAMMATSVDESRAEASATTLGRRARWIGPALLALIGAALTAAQMASAEPAKFFETREPARSR